MNQTRTFEGAMTALVTPMKEGGELDFDALADLVEEQIDAGIDALVAVGTTGESATLDMDEHIAVIKKVVELAAGRVPVIAGAGANATPEALELSRASHEVGADALLHVAGYYNRPTQEGLYRHFLACAEATPLPIILYNVPGRTACDLLPETVARLAENDRFVAIKEATANVRRVSELVSRVGDRMAILSGEDFAAFSSFGLGGRGVISVISNVMPRQVAQMWDAASEGDWEKGRQLHYELMPLCELLFAETNPIPVKKALELCGKIRGGIRLPLVPATEGLTERLRAQLDAQGMLP